MLRLGGILLPAGRALSRRSVSLALRRALPRAGAAGDGAAQRAMGAARRSFAAARPDGKDADERPREPHKPVVAMPRLPRVEDFEREVAEGDPKYLAWLEATRDSPSDVRVKQKGALATFLALSKARLGTFVALSTAAGYAVVPGVAMDPALLAWTIGGTALCISSANSFNQWIEAPFDAQMARTAQRSLPSGSLRPEYALAVGALSGAVGVAMLASQVNLLTAGLGLANIVLYAGVYTPMKRTTVYNTYVGAIVGAIPPVMGWTAATGSIDLGAMVLAGALFSWQMPHFLALAWNLRDDYARAGYRMMPVVSLDRTTKLALRHALYLCTLPFVSYAAGITGPDFIVLGSALNARFVHQMYQFRADPCRSSARSAFFGSLYYLPILFVLIIGSRHAKEYRERSKALPAAEESDGKAAAAA